MENLCGTDDYQLQWPDCGLPYICRVFKNKCVSLPLLFTTPNYFRLTKLFNIEQCREYKNKFNIRRIKITLVTFLLVNVPSVAYKFSHDVLVILTQSSKLIPKSYLMESKNSRVFLYMYPILLFTPLYFNNCAGLDGASSQKTSNLTNCTVY